MDKHRSPLKVQSTPFGYEIRFYDSLVSTSDKAKEIAKVTGRGKIIVLAETQTGGKGRHGRRWISPEGGIWFSILLRPQISPKNLAKLTLLASSAVAKAIEARLNLETRVKWPNDVLVGGKKICGILTEASIRGNDTEFVVVGVGINANMGLNAFPKSLRSSVTTLKQELGYAVDREALIGEILKGFERRCSSLQHGGWDSLLDEWKSRAAFLGAQVEVASSDGVLIGKALDVSEDGALIVKLENGQIKKIVSGDVALR